MDWKKNIDPLLKTHLEKQIAESLRHRSVYNLAKNPANAQLWVAITNLSKELFDINLKLNYLERALQETLSKKTPKKAPSKKRKVKKTKKKFKRTSRKKK